MIDGMRNIWIIKAPDVSCGVGMQLSHNIQEILDFQKGMGCRTVQKYVEIPLLATERAAISVSAGAPLMSDGVPGVQKSRTTGACATINVIGSKDVPSSNGVPLPAELPTVASKHTNGFKFDLRIWVLVTSFEPLSAHIYSAVYGRRCSVPYRDDVKTLNDRLVHLTNYSVQKKAVGSSASALAAKATSSAGRNKAPSNSNSTDIDDDSSSAAGDDVDTDDALTTARTDATDDVYTDNKEGNNSGRAGSAATGGLNITSGAKPPSGAKPRGESQGKGNKSNGSSSSSSGNGNVLVKGLNALRTLRKNSIQAAKNASLAAASAASVTGSSSSSSTGNAVISQSDLLLCK
jgi:hypothetical protein